MKIALVVGHESENQGAYGNVGIGEWAFNRELIVDIMRVMNSENLYMFMRNASLRNYTHKMIDLHERMDAKNIDISIEFHFNSFWKDSVQGHEVLYCSSRGGKEANTLNTLLDIHLSTTNRGPKKISMKDNGGGFCCRGKSIALVLEPFFGAHQHKFVRGGELRKDLINAIVEYLDEKEI